jgi:hypothetical protein
MLYNSAFISYGQPDEQFAKYLHRRLTKAGVSAFLFARDAPVGQPLHSVMRNGVNQYDRMILLCSEASLKREGVLNEIEEALRREAREGGRSILIPVSLDPFVLSHWNPSDPSAAQAIRDRVILLAPSASSLKKADFDRLLRALQRSEYGALAEFINDGGFSFHCLKFDLGGDAILNSLTIEIVREPPMRKLTSDEANRVQDKLRSYRRNLDPALLALVAGLTGAEASEISYAAVAKDPWNWNAQSNVIKMKWALFNTTIRKQSPLPTRVKWITVEFDRWYSIDLTFWTSTTTIKVNALERLWAENEAWLRPLCEAAWAYLHGRLKTKIGPAHYWWQDSVEASQARTPRDCIRLLPSVIE